MKLGALSCGGKEQGLQSQLPGLALWPLLASSVTLGKFLKQQPMVSGT